MNTAVISGNITREPEIFAPNNSDYTLIKFSIANNDERKKNGDQWESVASYFDMQYWTKKPQYWLIQITKGRYCVCHCQAKQDRWNDDNGNTRSRVVFKVIGFPEGFPKLDQNSTGTADEDIPF